MWKMDGLDFEYESLIVYGSFFLVTNLLQALFHSQHSPMFFH